MATAKNPKNPSGYRHSNNYNKMEEIIQKFDDVVRGFNGLCINANITSFSAYDNNSNSDRKNPTAIIFTDLADLLSKQQLETTPSPTNQNIPILTSEKSSKGRTPGRR